MVSQQIYFVARNISGDKYYNTLGNLMWVKEDLHKKFCEPIAQKMNISFNGDKDEILKIIEDEPFMLMAVWTKKPLDNKSSYHTPVYNALDRLKEFQRVIFIGDFNTGSVQGAGNAHWYEKLNDRFVKDGFYNCAGSQEWIPTFYRGNGFWLDDHCFASNNLQTVSFGIGNSGYWTEYSDH